jgi:modulator of FtsH protease HflK
MSEHNHEHNHEHGHEHHVELPEVEAQKNDLEGLDASGKSLSDALRISFIVLKIIMLVLVIAFLASGFETVASDEEAIVLRFGSIQGDTENKVLGPGWHWIFPYPIDQMIKIPTKKTVNLPIESFWYRESATGQAAFRETDPLNPILDGYCLTRSQISVSNTGDVNSVNKQTGSTNTGESDYNIVHTRWQLTYQINNIESFIRNIQLRQIKPGEIYFDVIREQINPLLKSLFESSVVSTLVNYTIDDAIKSRDKIPRDVVSLLQNKLDAIKSGIKVVSAQLINSVCPPQVKTAFDASTLASQQSEKEITNARTKADQLLKETAGQDANELFESIKNDKVPEEIRELLWSKLAGKAQDKLSQAHVYAAQIEKKAQADAMYLQSILPEYRQRPKLVTQGIYLDAIKQIYSKSEEKFFIQVAEGVNGREIRININRDPKLSTTKKSQNNTTETNR